MRKKIALFLLLAVILSGCSALNSVEYPDGFSENGIENFEEALGDGSVYQNISSVRIETRITSQLPSGREVSVSETKKVSLIETRSYIQRDLRQSTEEEYVNNSAAYIRVQDGDTVTYRREGGFDTEDALSIQKISDVYSGLDMNVESVSSGVITYKGDVSDLPSDSPVRVQYPDIIDGEFTFKVRENGLPISAEFELIFDASPGTSQTQRVVRNSVLEFTNYNSTEVERPGWVSEAIDQTTDN